MYIYMYMHVAGKNAYYTPNIPAGDDQSLPVWSDHNTDHVITNSPTVITNMHSMHMLLTSA